MEFELWFVVKVCIVVVDVFVLIVVMDKMVEEFCDIEMFDVVVCLLVLCLVSDLGVVLVYLCLLLW